MGIFSDERRDEFKPNCEPVGKTEDGKLMIVCRPELREGDRVWKGERETKITIVGRDKYITDDGGAQDFVLKRLKTWLDENV